MAINGASAFRPYAAFQQPMQAQPSGPAMAAPSFAPAQDTATFGSPAPKFGHGNPRKHPDILKEAFRKQFRRDRNHGKHKGVAMEDFVAAKMAEKLSGKKGNALRK